MACNQNVDEQLNCLHNGQIVVFLYMLGLLPGWRWGRWIPVSYSTLVSGLLWSQNCDEFGAS